LQHIDKLLSFLPLLTNAQDFVLDNSTLQDFNRDLLFDIKLLAVRKRRAG
jgi:hypothetical protein